MRQFVAPAEELAQDGDRVRVRAAGRDIIVARSEDQLWAIDNRCSHADIPMHRGRVRRCVLTCPSHLAQFNLVDGSVKRGPVEGDPNNVSPLETFEVEVVDGEVYLEIPEAEGEENR
jgi:nitrite reductase/ring-hydroxylating ferredoxin subunit